MKYTVYILHKKHFLLESEIHFLPFEFKIFTITDIHISYKNYSLGHNS